MRKVKSRNFILIVMGILIMILLSGVVVKTMVYMINEMKNRNIYEETQNKIAVTSSEIKLNGRGNFISSTPKISKTNITDFNVTLENSGDSVFYSVSLCNKNKESLIYKNLDYSNILCVDEYGSNSFDDVEVNLLLLNKNKEVCPNQSIESMECVDLVVDVEYIGDVSKEISVYIDKIFLDLELK